MRMVKRGLDIAMTLAALVLLAPVLAICVVLVRLNFGKPVIYRAERVGYLGQTFTLFKLRSMTTETDVDGQLLPDDQRLTRFGRFLRNASVDELPSLINVLKGEMSLVGPRPFSSLYKDRYTPEQNKRHDVLPGITGWSQINGRNNLSWEEKFELDLWYIANWSLALDARILLRTVARVLKRSDVNKDGHATAPEFMGTLARKKGSDNKHEVVR